jgi:hypothetical protein
MCYLLSAYANLTINIICNFTHSSAEYDHNGVAVDVDARVLTASELRLPFGKGTTVTGDALMLDAFMFNDRISKVIDRDLAGMHACWHVTTPPCNNNNNNNNNGGSGKASMYLKAGIAILPHRFSKTATVNHERGDKGWGGATIEPTADDVDVDDLSDLSLEENKQGNHVWYHQRSGLRFKFVRADIDLFSTSAAPLDSDVSLTAYADVRLAHSPALFVKLTPAAPTADRNGNDDGSVTWTATPKHHWCALHISIFCFEAGSLDVHLNVDKDAAAHTLTMTSSALPRRMASDSEDAWTTEDPSADDEVEETRALGSVSPLFVGSEGAFDTAVTVAPSGDFELVSNFKFPKHMDGVLSFLTAFCASSPAFSCAHFLQAVDSDVAKLVPLADASVTVSSSSQTLLLQFAVEMPPTGDIHRLFAFAGSASSAVTQRGDSQIVDVLLVVPLFKPVATAALNFAPRDSVDM